MPHSVTSSSAMSRPSSTSTSSATAFPKPAGVTLEIPERNGDQVSPSRSTFSFEDSQKSPSPRDSVTRTTSYGEKRELAPAVRIGTQTSYSSHSSRQRTQYYEDQFAYKDTTGSVRERVSKDSPIIAELRTNVIIKDEYTLVTDLSHHLSTRYQRPDSSIMITVDHSACILLGGSFEPTYILTISALGTQLQPTTNKRNAALIQQFLIESLGVTPDRGIIKFMAIPEENLATNGITIFGEIERSERQQAEELGTGLKRALTKSSRRSGPAKAKSSMQLSRSNSKTNGRSVVTPPLPSPKEHDGETLDEKTHSAEATLAKEVSTTDKLGRSISMKRKPSKVLDAEKSAVKSSTNAIPSIPIPPVPEDGPTPKIGKRKSFAAIFRR